MSQLITILRTKDLLYVRVNTHAGYIPPAIYRRSGHSVQWRLVVCLFVRAVTGKRLELSTPSLVHINSIAVALHALTKRSKGNRSRSHDYENRHGRTVASDHVPYFAYQYAAVLRAVVDGVCLHVDTTACFLVAARLKKRIGHYSST